MLPVREPKRPGFAMLDARNVKAPVQAPNLLLIMIDDMGFDKSSAFRGPIHMPEVERLATEGLRYNPFHTTPLCSPTRLGFDKFYGLIGGEANRPLRSM